METVLLTTLLISCIVFPLFQLWKWFRPQIEIVQFIEHYSIYIIYNKWDGPEYKGRVAKHLFDI